MSKQQQKGVKTTTIVPLIHCPTRRCRVRRKYLKEVSKKVYDEGGSTVATEPDETASKSLQTSASASSFIEILSQNIPDFLEDGRILEVVKRCIEEDPDVDERQIAQNFINWKDRPTLTPQNIESIIQNQFRTAREKGYYRKERKINRHPGQIRKTKQYIEELRETDGELESQTPEERQAKWAGIKQIMEESLRKAKEFRKRKESANRDFKSGRISREEYDSILKQIRDEARDAWG